MKGKLIFEETQRFRYTWSYWVVLTTAVPIIGGVIFGFNKQILNGEVFSDNPMGDTELIVVGLLVSALLIGLIWLFHFMKLEVSVDQSSIYYSFFPFIISKKVVSKGETKNLQVKTYDPISDYGGWGLRWTFNGNKALNVRGDKGLEIVFRNGKKLLLGTQKPKELQEAVEKVKENWFPSNG